MYCNLAFMHRLLDIFALFVVLLDSAVFVSPVFYLSEKVVVNGCILIVTFNPAICYRRFHFFVYNLLLTSPSFIRI